MNKGVWEGRLAAEMQNRILVLGESHYGSDDKTKTVGDFVDYDTKDVIRYYLNMKAGGSSTYWARFFDLVAESFGYKDYEEFYRRIYFGNYVDKLCGIGDYAASTIITKDRERLNHDLFEFVNKNHIDVVICFSILVYNNLPARNNEHELTENRTVIGTIGSRNNIFRKFRYEPAVRHDFCDTELEKGLTVFGIRHPSSQGGFNVEQVHDEFLNHPELRLIII